jgi:hypothetical protein
MSKAEAGCTTPRIRGLQIKKSRFASLTAEAFDIAFASTSSCFNVTLICAARRITGTWPASCLSEGMESRLATVTLITHHSWLTAASAITITLCAERTNRTAVARKAGFVGPKAEEVLPAPLTVGAICIILAVGAVATVASGTVKFRIKVAFL